MRVVRQCQTKVADVLRLVHRLRERTHHQGLDERAQLRVAHARGNARQVTGADFLGNLQLDAEHVQGGLQVVELALLRRLVHTIQARHAQPLQFLGHGHVGQHHAFLDQPVGVVAPMEFNGPYLLLFAEHKFGFRGIEVECPAARRAP